MHNAGSIGVGSQLPVLVRMVYSVTKGRLPQKEMGELLGSPLVQISAEMLQACH